MSDETTLLPCPFCGGKAALRMCWMEDGHRYRAVECVECGATTPGNYSEVGDQSTWDWNARTPEQAIAATLGDDEYEAKMDELLCRLTNGKWSKSKDYDLDFMESCINEEFEDLYAKELADATLGSVTCEMETDWDYLHDGIPDAPEDTWAYMCSACGWSFRYDRGIKPKHCPNCGAKVVKQ